MVVGDRGGLCGEPAGEGVGAGVRKEDTALRDKLNAAITAMAKSGKLVEITSKYPQLVGKMTLPSGN